MPESQRTVRVLDDAQDDAESAIAWYRAEAGDDVASRFAQEVDATLEQIAEWPFSGRAYDQTTRGVVLHTFPFIVLYRLTTDTIDVLAVAHGRRHPHHWRER